MIVVDWLADGSDENRDDREENDSSEENNDDNEYNDDSDTDYILIFFTKCMTY
jgi:hypothetical protein